MQSRNADLALVPTVDLITELRKRESVKMTTADPYQDVAVSVKGPAIVIVVTD